MTHSQISTATRTVALFLAMLVGLVPRVEAQTVTLNDLPSWEGNTRFATNVVSEVRHPSLSLNGFDCGSNCDEGYGLKQILEQIPGLSSGSPIRDVYDKLVDLHDNTFDTTPSSRGEVDDNVNIRGWHR